MESSDGVGEDAILSFVFVYIFLCDRLSFSQSLSIRCLPLNSLKSLSLTFIVVFVVVLIFRLLFILLLLLVFVAFTL